MNKIITPMFSLFIGLLNFTCWAQSEPIKEFIMLTTTQTELIVQHRTNVNLSRFYASHGSEAGDLVNEVILERTALSKKTQSIKRWDIPRKIIGSITIAPTAATCGILAPADALADIIYSTQGQTYQSMKLLGGCIDQLIRKPIFGGDLEQIALALYESAIRIDSKNQQTAEIIFFRIKAIPANKNLTPKESMELLSQVRFSIENR